MLTLVYQLYRKAETELVIMVTPYLVKPVTANQIALPTDGFKAASDLERVLLGRNQSGGSGGDRPKPSSAPSENVVAPSLGSASPFFQQQRIEVVPAPKAKGASSKGANVAPGFSGN